MKKNRKIFETREKHTGFSTVKQEEEVFIHEEDIKYTPDTDDQLIKLSRYGPLRTGSMNTQVSSCPQSTASLRSHATHKEQRSVCIVEPKSNLNETW